MKAGEDLSCGSGGCHGCQPAYVADRKKPSTSRASRRIIASEMEGSALGARYLFLEPQFLSFELLNHRRIGGRSRHLVAKSGIEPGMFGLESIHVR